MLLQYNNITLILFYHIEEMYPDFDANIYEALLIKRHSLSLNPLKHYVFYKIISILQLLSHICLSKLSLKHLSSTETNLLVLEIHSLV